MEYKDKIKLEWGVLYDKYQKYIDKDGFVKASGAGFNIEIKNINQDLKDSGINAEYIDDGWYWYRVRPEKLVDEYTWNQNNHWYKITHDEIKLSDDVVLIEAYNITTSEHKYLSKEDFGLVKEFTHCKFIRKNTPPFY